MPDRGLDCREKLWRRFVEEIILERDDPSSLAGRGRVSGKGGRSAASKATLRDTDDTDKAYEREYLSHDRKRMKRE